MPPLFPLGNLETVLEKLAAAIALAREIVASAFAVKTLLDREVKIEAALFYPGAPDGEQAERPQRVVQGRQRLVKFSFERLAV
jgi:hypothetical protein